MKFPVSWSFGSGEKVQNRFTSCSGELHVTIILYKMIFYEKVAMKYFTNLNTCEVQISHSDRPNSLLFVSFIN